MIGGIRVSSWLICLFFTMQAHHPMLPPLPPPRSDVTYSHEGDHVCKLCRCSLIWSRLIWHSPPLSGCVPSISEKTKKKNKQKKLMLKQEGKQYKGTLSGFNVNKGEPSNSNPQWKDERSCSNHWAYNHGLKDVLFYHLLLVAREFLLGFFVHVDG